MRSTPKCAYRPPQRAAATNPPPHHPHPFSSLGSTPPTRGGVTLAGVETLRVAADGSALSNPGPAGWCWYVDETCWRAGGWNKGTNNQAELRAVLDLLKSTRDYPGPITLLCDSRYVIDCCTKWMPGWKARGWKKADKTPVLNREILEEIDAELAGRDITFTWVKGHAGHDLNEAADERARAAATAIKNGNTPDEGPGFTREERPTASKPSTGLTEATSAALADDLTATFTRLESELVSDEVRGNPKSAGEYLAADYVEHATNGVVRGRDEVLASIRPIGEQVAVTPLELFELAADTYLFRWHSAVRGYGAIRATIWVKGGTHGWQARFHQGTTAPAKLPGEDDI